MSLTHVIFLICYDYLNFCYSISFCSDKVAVENFITSIFYITKAVIFSQSSNSLAFVIFPQTVPLTHFLSIP